MENAVYEKPAEMAGFSTIALQILESMKQMQQAMLQLAQQHSVTNNFQGATIHQLYINGDGVSMANDSGGTTESSSDVPLPEKMCHAAEKTQSMGLWWSMRSWAVVYRIYQIKGYKKGYSQFVDEVKGWPVKKPFDYECNFDAIQKPISQGMLDGTPDDWEKRGGLKQAIKLGRAMLEILEDKSQKTIE